MPPALERLDWIEFRGPKITEHVSNARIEEAVMWCSSRHRDISHWLTTFRFKSTPDKVHAISLNMMRPASHKYNKERTNTLGSLVVTTFDTSSTSSGISSQPRVRFPAEFRTDVTVANLLQKVEERGLKFYKFNECHSGCLCWNFELLKMLTELGWVNSHSKRKLEEAIENWHKENPGHKNLIHMPPHRGEFVQGPLAVKK